MSFFLSSSMSIANEKNEPCYRIFCCRILYVFLRVRRSLVDVNQNQQERSSFMVD